MRIPLPVAVAPRLAFTVPSSSFIGVGAIEDSIKLVNKLICYKGTTNPLFMQAVVPFLK